MTETSDPRRHSRGDLTFPDAGTIHSAFRQEVFAELNRLKAHRRTLAGCWTALKNGSARLLRRAYCLGRGRHLLRNQPHGPLRIVQVNTHDIIGGAERTSYDLHCRYRTSGHHPTLVVGGKYGADGDVFKIPFRTIDWKPAMKWRDQWGLTEVLYPTPLLGCFEWPHLRQADVVHIHNMHGQFWNSATLVPLGLQHPVVLTLHDEYTLSGDCCYTYDCERWTRSCGNCPQIGLERSARYSLGAKDLTRLNIRIKRAIFRAPRAYPLVIVTPSRWLADRARRSPNLRHLPILCINNGVDLQYWRPMDQAKARAALELPAGKTIGLLVASYLSDKRKGFDQALAAIKALPPGHNLLFVLVGNLSDEIKVLIDGLPIIATGYVSEKIKMLHLFGACDFVYAMSRVDNLPYMCVEALACGRPVFGSAVGGIPEIINHPLLGWLAPSPFNPEQTMRTLLEIDRENPDKRAARFAACHQSAIARFCMELMTARYLSLYREMMDASLTGRPPDLTCITEV